MPTHAPRTLCCVKTDLVTWGFAQDKWEATSDSEKPAAVAIIIGAVIAQIAIGATMNAVSHLSMMC